MKHVPKVLVIIVALSAYNAYADCGKGKTVFSCLTAKSKKIEVCDMGKTIKYSYGRVGEPEIVIKVPREDAIKSVSEGIGRMHTGGHIINIPNDSYNYAVFYDFGYYEGKLVAEIGGVIVEKNEHKLATVNCEKNIKSRIRGINLKSAD